MTVVDSQFGNGIDDCDEWHCEVSVCLLSYNHGHVIEDAVTSILKQEFRDFELVISDDCSDDRTWMIVNSLLGTDSRIRLIRTPRNLGMAGNANFAISRTSAPYVALLHHDDIYDEKLLSAWVGVMNLSPEVGFVFNGYRDESGNVEALQVSTGVLDGQFFLRKYLFPKWGCPVRGTAMIRRSCWNSIGGMREQFGLLADVDLWIRLARKFSVGYVPETLITVRHRRPSKYPNLYKYECGWSWRRRRYLYEIHAENRLEYFSMVTIHGKLNWWWFRIRMGIDTLKWLAYAVIKRRPEMILSSAEGRTEYECGLVKVFRHLLIRCSRFACGERGGRRL